MHLQFPSGYGRVHDRSGKSGALVSSASTAFTRLYRPSDLARPRKNGHYSARKPCQFALVALFAAGFPIAPANACCMGGSPVNGAMPQVAKPNVPPPNVGNVGKSAVDTAINTARGAAQGGGDTGGAAGAGGRTPPDPNNFGPLDPSTENAIQTALNAPPDPAEANKTNLRNAVDTAQAGYDAAVDALNAEQAFRGRVADLRNRSDWGNLTPEEIARVKREGGSMDDTTAWNNFLNDRSRIDNLVQNVDNAAKNVNNARAAALAGHAWD